MPLPLGDKPVGRFAKETQGVCKEVCIVTYSGGSSAELYPADTRDPLQPDGDTFCFQDFEA